MAGLDFLEEELDALAERGRRRSLRSLHGGQGRTISLDGRDVLNFSSNDYLGLAASPALAEAACVHARHHGGGSGASRLIAGNHAVFEDLERGLACWQEREAALAFNSGYQANIGILTALAGEGDLIVSDELNHASLIDGCRLSRGEVAIYRHADAQHADEILRERGRVSRRRFLVSDGVFSMDGDEAPLGELAEVARRRDAILIIDEAHAVGVYGPKGRGLAAARTAAVDVHLGTLGKAFGSFGAYVCGPGVLREWLINRARSFIFTTALPPSVAGMSIAGLGIIEGAEGDALRGRLWALVERTREGLAELGLLAPGAGSSPIFPIVVGEEEAAMRCCQALLDRGIYVQGIRPPTVPTGTSRLRLALMARHEDEDLERVLDALRELRDQGVLPPAPLASS